MMIKVKKNWKDLVDSGPAHTSLSRRDFIARGMATGAMAVALPHLVARDFVSQALANPLACPPTSGATPTGAIATLCSAGGPTQGARFLNSIQAGAVSASSSMAKNYGIAARNLFSLGPANGSNSFVDAESAFGATLLLGPPGFPGGAPAWQKSVLANIAAGGVYGPFNQDDGAGIGTGIIGQTGNFLRNQLSTGINVGVTNPLASWASGLPAAKVALKALTPASLAAIASVTPPVGGTAATGAFTTAEALGFTSGAIASLVQTFGLWNGRKGSQGPVDAASCGNAALAGMASPTYGASLFNPAGIPALTRNVTLTNVPPEMQALLAAYYQQAMGVVGGVTAEFNGRDYHGQNPANVIAPADIEDASALVMFLLACHSAQTRGAFILTSNGQAIANGFQSVAAKINGANVTVNAPVAKGDAGGKYNAGIVVFYDPKGSAPKTLSIGTIETTNGNALSDPSVASVPAAMISLYASALAWVNNGTIPQAAVNAFGTASPKLLLS